MPRSFWAFLLPIIFLTYSLPIFQRVLSTTQSVIDEEFHLRQGFYFCNKRFDVWDPKITTFPGLYLASLVLNPLNLCSVMGLRSISLVAATINVVVLYKLRTRVLGGSATTQAAMDAISLAALPPLYFFSHVYYTDTLALTTVLMLYYYWDKQSHLQASIYGAASVLMRQTNIVWVGMMFGISALDVLTKNYAEYNNLRTNEISLCRPRTWYNMLTSFRVLSKTTWNVLLKCSFYLVIILPFIGFIYLNESVVLGDKSAHRATVHIPQLFYFVLFTLAFSPTLIIVYLHPTLQTLRRHMWISLIACAVCLLVVMWNTLVHPYLLADNRHYIFYVWNRFYGRYKSFKYAIVPVYVIGLALIHQTMHSLRDSIKIMYWLAIILSLCFQRLLEMRYFLTPYVLLRLNIRPAFERNIMRWQWLELGYYIMLNAITFYIFFTKEVNWPNFEEPQRIIW